MILHLGSNMAIFTKDIVAILNLKTAKSKLPEEAISVSEDPPRSLIITYANGKQRLYLSPISSYALRDRCGRFPETI